MKLLRILYILFILMLFPIYASVNSPKQDATVAYEMGYFYDNAPIINPEIIILYGQFTPFKNFLNSTEIKGTHWIKIKLNNTTDTRQKRVIYYSENLLYQAFFFEFQGNRTTKRYECGSNIGLQERMIKYYKPAYIVEMAPNEEKTVLLAARTHMPLIGLLQVQTFEEFYTHAAYVSYFYFFCFGIIFAMFIYNIFLYIFYRERLFGYYILYLIAFSLTVFHQMGLAAYFLDAQAIEQTYAMMPLGFFFFILFSRELLRKEIHTRLFLRITQGYMILFLFSASLFVLNHPYSAAVLKITVMSFFFFAVYLLVVGKTQTRLYLLALSFYLASLSVFAFVANGTIPYNDFTRNINIMGATIEMLFLSVILANRMNLLKQEILDLRTRQNEILRHKVDEKTKSLKLLFQELHHRVKNNLQFIQTFLWTKKKMLSDPQAIEAFDVTEKRIQTVLMLHDLLYTKDGSTVDLQAYMEKFLSRFKEEDSNVTLNYNIEKVRLSFDMAVTLGFILNELIVNSYKYAFHHTSAPQIDIHFMSRREDHTCVLSYQDNGCGFDCAILEESKGLGYELIHEFVRKFGNASVELDTTDGVSVTIWFEDKGENEE